MPLPQLGETWTNPMGNGIVSEVRGERVTFISLSGARHPVQWRPALEDLWKKIEEAVKTDRLCSKQGCTQDAMLSYKRPKLTEVFEIVCPFHAPRGAQLSRDLEGEATRFKGSVCESCKTDAVEVFGELDRSQQGSMCMWNCRYCGKWWLTVDVYHPDTLTELTARLSTPDNYRVESIVEPADHDPALMLKTYMIKLRHVGFEQIKGVQPKTRFDFILSDDDTL